MARCRSRACSAPGVSAGESMSDSTSAAESRSRSSSSGVPPPPPGVSREPLREPAHRARPRASPTDAAAARSIFPGRSPLCLAMGIAEAAPPSRACSTLCTALRSSSSSSARRASLCMSTRAGMATTGERACRRDPATPRGGGGMRRASALALRRLLAAPRASPGTRPLPLKRTMASVPPSAAPPRPSCDEPSAGWRRIAPAGIVVGESDGERTRVRTLASEVPVLSCIARPTTTRPCSSVSADASAASSRSLSCTPGKPPPPPPPPPAASESWWNSAKFWGGLGAIAGWGMTGSAIYDSQFHGPEVISLTMTPVMIIYSSLFARWAFVVKPQNLLLCACHVSNVVAQLNQLRRAIEFKLSQGEEAAVQDMGVKAAVGAATLAGLILSKPMLQPAVVGMGIPGVSTFAAADAGPFTVHFWAPMSKWLISGASFFELDRPTDKISITQYSALTATGFFFTRYALLVVPVNYVLCSVNIALFASSAWHLGRKIKADYIDPK
mmetsp:Transcript_8045/g.20712  ORF Transcript_8045/g.20712 Transcript_8045/m.20712 type:complete len:499 (-) Transcript_8045:553-2049(-)